MFCFWAKIKTNSWEIVGECQAVALAIFFQNEFLIFIIMKISTTCKTGIIFVKNCYKRFFMNIWKIIRSVFSKYWKSSHWNSWWFCTDWEILHLKRVVLSHGFNRINFLTEFRNRLSIIHTSKIIIWKN